MSQPFSPLAGEDDRDARDATASAQLSRRRKRLELLPPVNVRRAHGIVEGWTETSVWGWALDQARPHDPVSVELWDGEVLIVRLRADIYRPDVSAGGQPGAVCGFSLPIPQHLLTGGRHVLHLRIAGHGEDLQSSPLIFDGGKPPLTWADVAAVLPQLEERAATAPDAAALGELLAPLLGTLGAIWPRYMQALTAEGQDRVGGAIDLGATYSDHIAMLLRDIAARYPRLDFPEVEAPEASIVVPVYGKFAYTYRCLASILAALPEAPIEIVVVDDASPDETVFLPTFVTGAVRYIRQQRNGGFIAACNAGASAARGRYLLFLNNDTEVKPRWLDALLDTFREQPSAGLVGSKLLFPDGTVQEAGGIVWRLGDGMNYGRGAQPEDPRLNYLRDVDYVSGASVMVPKALFDELGGFDAHFAPAYYEDTDLAFRIRQRGLRVLYQPLSAVIHHEGVTSGTDVRGPGAKRHQLLNARRFFDRWRCTLAAHGLNGHEPETEKERGVARRVLFIDETTPTPLEDAGSVAALSHMKALQALGAKVTFVPSDNMAHAGQATEALQRIGVECLHSPWFWSVEEVVRKRGGEFDAVYLHRCVNAFKYAGVIRAAMPKARIIYSVADLHHLRLEREAALSGSEAALRQAADLRAREMSAVTMADAVITHSSHEAAYLAEAAPGARIATIPWAVPLRRPGRGFAERSGLAYVGGYRHPPNVDAVVHFVREVMPHLRRMIPGLVFHIVGSHMPPGFHELAAADVVLDGFVADLGACLEERRLTVAPLRYGAGVKGKVLESLSRGVPCVASPVAAEGMDLRHSEDIAIADHPLAFAEQVAWLYQDEADWTRLQAGGLAYVERSCSEAAIIGHFRELFARLDGS